MTVTVAPVKSNATKPGVRDERRSLYHTGNGRAPGAGQSSPARPPLQDRWLHERLRSRVAVRLSDGKTLTGVLCGYDSYCLTLQTERARPPVLIYKAHVAYVRPEKEPPQGG